MAKTTLKAAIERGQSELVHFSRAGVVSIEDQWLFSILDVKIDSLQANTEYGGYLEKEVNLLPALMQEVENKIAVIRGVEVIADADVAALYGVETREVNQAVKNNTDKFPPHYMFELSHSELRDLKSKILISKVSNNNRKLTKVFTERGLYMLATVLKGERARQVTFAIIETFAKVRNLKRELVELHQETDKEKQASKMNMTRTCPSSSSEKILYLCCSI